MFTVDPTTKKITMHRGDTGSLTIHVTGYTFGTDDRALLTIKDSSGSEVMKRVYAMTDNSFDVEFANADTDYLPPSICHWDVRYIVNPDYDENENIIDGDAVYTPASPFELQILGTVGQI